MKFKYPSFIFVRSDRQMDKPKEICFKVGGIIKYVRVRANKNDKITNKN